MSGLYSFTGNSASNSYDFETDFGITVNVYFSIGEYIFPKYVNISQLTYNFGIQTSEPVKADPKVHKTVIYILYSHFTVKPESILFWTCDGMDGREKARDRKFDGWFANCRDQEFVKLNSIFVIEVEDIPISTYASVLYLKDNPFATEIEDAFNNLESDFGDKDQSVVED